MERNALVLEAVIDWVNAKKAEDGSTESNVVLGQSMGGVISRYALRNMENKGLTHDTRLYISFDSPHQGANIPLAGQYAYQHLTNWAFSTNIDNWVLPLTNFGLDLDINGALNLLDEPAPRQLLKNRVSDNLGIENSMHLQWQNKLEAMGYPQQTVRNVAVSNGSECGITQTFAPGDNLFDVEGNASPSLLTSTIANMIPGLTTFTTFSSVALLNNPDPLIGLLPGGRTTFEADFWGNAQPLNTTEILYKGRLTLRKRVLWVININANLTNRSVNSNSSILPFDYYHGGEYRLPSINIGGISGVLGSAGVNLSMENTFNFIPTPSALDIRRGSNSLVHQDYLRAYSGGLAPPAPLTSSFDAYITAYKDNIANENHINVLSRNGDFIASQLEDSSPSVFDCSAFCEGEIVGLNTVCNQESYSVAGFSGSISWSVFPSGIATVSSSGRVSRVGSNAGVVTLVASFNGGNCGLLRLEKKITVGSPRPQGLFNVLIDPWLGRIKVSVEPIEGATSYQWYLNGVRQSGSGETVEVFIPRGGCSSPSFNMGVRAVTQCGVSAIYSKSYANPCYNSFREENKVVYPNPAQDQVSIDLSKTSNYKANGKPFRVVIANQMGETMKQLSTHSSKPTIDVSDLKSGTYFIVIYTDDEVVRKTLLIE